MQEVVELQKRESFTISKVSIEWTAVEKLSELLQSGMHIGELSLSLGYAADLNTVLKFANALKNCASLRRLIIIAEDVKSLHLQPLFERISRIPGLQSLRFILKSRLNVSELTGIASLVEKQPFLHSLDVSECSLGQNSIIEIAEVLCANTTVKSLNLSGNYLGGEATRAVKALVRNNKSITHLDISHGHMVGSELSRILSMITVDSQLVELNLSKNPLTELGVHYLLISVEKNPKLTRLNVSQCSLTSRGMSVFLTGLQANSTLTTLSLAGYDFGISNLDFLTAFIRQNKVLQSLDLSQCGLYLGSLLKILDSVQCNRALRKIDLSRNFFGDDGCQLILDFLAQNKTLEWLSLNETQMSDAGLIILARLLSINTALKQLHLRGNQYTQASITVLLSALSRNTTLFSLDLGESVEDKQALDYLVGFIPENTRICAFGFMPKDAKRTKDLLALYENACIANKFITDTHHDFSCQCGRCLCVKVREIIKWVEKNKLDRYMNMALLIKAYLDPAEDHPNVVAFKKIPKDVLLYIFKLAYPELPQKTLSSVSQLLFFKARVAIPSPGVHRKLRENNDKNEAPSAPVLLKYLGVEISLRETKDSVIVSFSADAGNLHGFRHIAELCRQKIHTLLPYNNRHDIEFVTPEPERVLERGKHVFLSDEEHLFKIAVVGEVCSGKTAFVHRFSSNTYSQYFKATIGADLKMKTVGMGDSICKLQVWDLAGTRTCDKSTHMYLRYTHGIMLTVDLTRRQTYEETYENLLRDSEFPNLPILLVGLKADICQADEVKRFSLIADKLNIPCMVVSSKTGENVDAAFHLLLKMILVQKFPDYILKLRIRKATLDWFNMSRFYGELNQLLVEDVSVSPLTKVYNYKYGLYVSAVQMLNEWEHPEGLCKFYIKNLDNEDDCIRDDATKNFKRFKAVFPDIILRMIKSFHHALLSENSGIRCEAIQGLRVLHELKTDAVRNICVRQFRQIEFPYESWLKKIVDKIKEYKKPELVRDCIHALSAIQRDCFSILQEIGEQKICEEISMRVLQAFEEYLRQQPVAKVSVGKTL